MFGVHSHRDHVGRLMREAGWSRVIPIEQASRRNEEASKKLSHERWPALKKAEEEQATIDRARRSAVLSVADGCAHLSAWRADASPASQVDTRPPDRVISCIPLNGRLFMQVRRVSYDAVALVAHL